MGSEELSLYSTATQNTWRLGLALGNAPDARILRLRYQHVGIFWRYLTLKFALAPTQNLKFVLAPTPTPDAIQWNIGGVGPSGVGAGVGHVHFMLFMSISFASGTQRKLVFHWNMGFILLCFVPREEPRKLNMVWFVLAIGGKRHHICFYLSKNVAYHKDQC